MIQDALLTFSSAQAVTSAVGSTNTVDFSAVRDIGVGENLYVVVVVTTTMTDDGSNSTLTVALEGDSTTSISPDYTRDLFTIPAVSVAGTVRYSRLGPDDLNLQYARLLYTPNTGDLSAGKFTAFITHDIQKATAYADAITIS